MWLSDELWEETEKKKKKGVKIGDEEEYKSEVGAGKQNETEIPKLVTFDSRGKIKGMMVISFLT